MSRVVVGVPFVLLPFVLAAYFLKFVVVACFYTAVWSAQGAALVVRAAMALHASTRQAKPVH